MVVTQIREKENRTEQKRNNCVEATKINFKTKIK